MAGYSMTRRLENKAITEALQGHYSERDMLAKCDAAWEAAERSGSAKTMIQWLDTILPWYAGGKLPTKHIRVNTKFEDMLAALGSNEPVTIEGQVNEDSPAQ